MLNKKTNRVSGSASRERMGARNRLHPSKIANAIAGNFLKAMLLFTFVIWSMASLLSCHAKSESIQIEHPSEMQVNTTPNLIIGILPDPTGSFKHQSESLSEKLLYPIKQKFAAMPGTQYLEVAYVHDTSNLLVNRYVDVGLLTEPPKNKEAKNPWVSESETSPYEDAVHFNDSLRKVNEETWGTFMQAINQNSNDTAGTKSDVQHALNRLLIALNEYKDIKKYAILATDFKENLIKNFTPPDIPPDVEVLIVNGDLKIPDKYKNYHRFESIESAIIYILNQTK